MNEKLHQFNARCVVLCRTALRDVGPKSFAALKQECAEVLQAVDGATVLATARASPCDADALVLMAKQPEAKTLYQAFVSYKQGLTEFVTIAQKYGSPEESTMATCQEWKDVVAVISVFSVVQASLRKLKPGESRPSVMVATLADMKAVGGRVSSSLLEALHFSSDATESTVE